MGIKKPNVRIITASWDEQKAGILTVRYRVFVDEQNVPSPEEIDNYDAVSKHVLVFYGRTPIGTGRITSRGKIGRIAVLKHWRGHKIGRLIMHHLIEAGKDQGNPEIQLSAQTYAIPFYEKLGFTAFGDEYPDAGIMHRDMKLKPG